MVRTRLAAFSLAILASGCATKPAVPSIAQSPDGFLIERDLAGATNARGTFRSIAGPDRGFDARLEGRMENGVFILVEDFAFDDGEKDRKTWRLTRTGPSTYVGVREDVVGEAEGRIENGALRLDYIVKLGDRRVGFRDILIKQADGDIYNRATVGFWGLRVGSVELTIKPEAARAEAGL